MRLVDLEPRFVRYLPDNSIQHGGFGLAEAQGLDFLCPKCFAAHNGPIGTEHLGVTFAGRGVADQYGSHNKDGRPTRWNVAPSSTDFINLTLTPSIQVDGGCAWHGFITNGVIL